MIVFHSFPFVSENLVEDMSTAALGYQKVVQENRNLYNMVQDLKGKMIRNDRA